MEPLLEPSDTPIKDSQPATATIVTKPKPAPFKRSYYPAKLVSTKTMMQEAIKAVCTKFRKGFSLDKIRKYILQNYMLTANEMKYRIPLMKKFFKNALENGDIVNVKGVGLTGSFRVLSTSPLHTNSRQNIRKMEKGLTEKYTRKTQSNQKVAVAKSKKLKVKRVFSENMSDAVKYV